MLHRLIPCLILMVILLPSDLQAGPLLLRDAPHVWNIKPDEATVAWFTNDAGRGSVVEFGITTEYGASARPVARTWPLLSGGLALHHHVAVIRGLEPDTRYYYRIVAAAAPLTPADGSSSDDYYFTTARLPSDHSPFDFMVMGDGGEGNKYQRAMAHQMEKADFDFILHTGDVVYDRGSDAEWHVNYYPIYRNIIRNRPWFLSLGNHEYLGAPQYHVVSPQHGVRGVRLFRQEEFSTAGTGDPEPLIFKSQAAGAAAGYFENANLPDQGGSERYYSFDWGAVHFVVLDSNRSQTPGRPGDPQYEWLVDDLSKSDAPWKIVCFHHPMASLGKAAYAFTNESMINLRRDWHPVFEAHGVDVVFSGHDHNYQRTHPLVINADTADISRDDQRGVVHIVTGGGGSGLSDRSVDPPPAWHTGVFQKRHHFVLVRADGESLQIQAVADADINTPGVTEKQGLGGPVEILDSVRLLNRKRPAAD